jgi:hypothetical protein
MVVRVERVDVGLRRKARVELEAEQPAVPEVVDVRAEVGEEGGGWVREAVEDLDQAALLRDEDAAVRSEPDGRGLRQPAEDDVLLEAGRERCGRSVRGREERGRDERRGEASKEGCSEPQGRRRLS